jgi:hypothetical protein
MTSVFAAATGSTVPPTVPTTVLTTVPPVTTPSTVPFDPNSDSAASTLSDVISSVVDALGDNAYQTSVALIVATVAIVAMVNLKINKFIRVPVTIGAFWFGWLAWNTFTGQDNQLFPGDVSATKLWDVGTDDGRGFLIVVIVGCLAAVFVWRKGASLSSRIVMVLGFVLGASFVYNLVDSVNWT